MDLSHVLHGTADRLRGIKALVGSGVVAPMRPDRAVHAALAASRYGPTPATAYEVAAARRPEGLAFLDDRRASTFAALQRRTDAIAGAFRAAGVCDGAELAVLCRNHAGFAEATIAAAKAGAHVLYLNTGFAGPQLREVLEREGATAVVYDEEFAELVESAAPDVVRFVAWHENGSAHPTLDALAETPTVRALPRPATASRQVILTSGTTGTPKGAHRGVPRGVDAALALFERIPLRAGETTVIAAPLFHAWGLSHLFLAGTLASTVVLHRRFDPEATLHAVARHRATTLVVVPVMLQRILALDPSVIDRYDVSCLRVVASSGSALAGDLAVEWMDRFGDNLYNLYGSTEVAWATIATPADLRAAPGTAGRPPLGTTVKVVDDDGRELPPGAVGRVFVRNDLVFEGYTGGGSKESLDGMLSVGDVGRFDEQGRLFVEGRADDMIVSGGENVYPAEVENLLARHPAVEEAVVVGVPDDEWGARLKAFVVKRPGTRVTADQVKAHVRDHLARYKVPRDVVFVRELPRNETGKVLRRELR